MLGPQVRVEDHQQVAGSRCLADWRQGGKAFGHVAFEGWLGEVGTDVLVDFWATFFGVNLWLLILQMMNTIGNLVLVCTASQSSS